MHRYKYPIAPANLLLQRWLLNKEISLVKVNRETLVVLGEQGSIGPQGGTGPQSSRGATGAAGPKGG